MCEAVISAGPKNRHSRHLKLSKLCSIADCDLLPQRMVFVGFSSTIYNVAIVVRSYLYRLFLGTYLTRYTIL